MKAHYFYLSQGVTRGPLTKDELIGLIQGRQIHAFDLVLKETSAGIEDWKAVSEMPEFSDSFRDVVRKEEPLDWVVLVRRGKGQYLQNGPFSSKDIRNHLREGRLRYTDYAWQTGMTEWILIADLSEFKSKKKTPQIGKIDPLDDKTLLPAIPKVSFAKKQSAQYDSNPFLADKGEVIELREAAKPEEIELPIEVSEEVIEDQIAEKDFSRPFIFESKKSGHWVMVASSILLVCVLIFVYLEHKKRDEGAINLENKVITQPKSAEQIEPVTEEKNIYRVEANPEPKAVLQEVEEKKPPTQIGFTTEKDTLFIQSNGSRHFPIKVLIVGLPGQLQEGKMWFKALSLRPEKGNISVSMSNLDLVPGHYRIRVSTESGLKIEKDLAYDADGKQFARLRNKNRKEQSYWFYVDRIRLISRVAKLKDFLNQFSQLKEVNFSTLKDKEPVSEKIFYFEWEKYTELKNKVLRLSQKSRSLIQTKDLQELKIEIDTLSQRLGLLSVWR